MTQLPEEVSRFDGRARDSALPPLLSLQVLEVSGCFFSRLESSCLPSSFTGDFALV